MGTRARVGATFVALLALTACGGGGGGDGDEQAGGDGTGAEAVVDLDPCSLLDDDAAAALTGGEVERTDAPLGTALAASIGCSYRPAADAEGAAIAASLVLAAADEGTAEAAKDARVAELTAEAPEAEVEIADLDLGDAAAVVTTDTLVQVVYVVQEVVVSVEVVPSEPVDDDVVAEVVDFAEATVEPVTRAFEVKEEREADDDADDEGAVERGEIAGLWTGDWGTMAIEVDGDEVRAAYTHDDGRITGTFEDGVFRGRWTELPSREGPSDAGEVEFRFAKTDDDTIALDGRWDYDGDESPLGHDDWDLTLSEDEVPIELVEAFEDQGSFEAP